MFHYSNRHHTPPVPGALAVEFSNVCVAHPGSKNPALAQINLRIQAGTRVALVGHNGAGKSTLLKTIAGLLKADGHILLYGQPIGACHHRVAYLPQRGEVDWRFPVSVRRLVMTGRYVHLGWLKRPQAEDQAIVEAVLAELHLTDLAERQIGQLSGGQQQRAMLARALAQQSALLLLDEPLNAVDAETQDIIFQVLERLHQQGKTILAATHDTARLEAQFDCVLRLAGGRIAA